VAEQYQRLVPEPSDGAGLARPAQDADRALESFDRLAAAVQIEEDPANLAQRVGHVRGRGATLPFEEPKRREGRAERKLGPTLVMQALRAGEQLARALGGVSRTRRRAFLSAGEGS
jgi:hypothetical protein